MCQKFVGRGRENEQTVRQCRSIQDEIRNVGHLSLTP